MTEFRNTMKKVANGQIKATATEKLRARAALELYDHLNNDGKFTYPTEFALVLRVINGQELIQEGDDNLLDTVAEVLLRKAVK